MELYLIFKLDLEVLNLNKCAKIGIAWFKIVKNQAHIHTLRTTKKHLNVKTRRSKGSFKRKNQPTLIWTLENEDLFFKVSIF
jgi:hypothetical protein